MNEVISTLNHVVPRMISKVDVNSINDDDLRKQLQPVTTAMANVDPERLLHLKRSSRKMDPVLENGYVVLL